MQTKLYQIGWNMAADDHLPLPMPTLLHLAEDVVGQEFPRALDDAALLYHQNQFIGGYLAQFAWRTRFAIREVRR